MNEIVIGAEAVGNGSYTTTFGTTRMLKVYMGQTGHADVYTKGIHFADGTYQHTASSGGGVGGGGVTSVHGSTTITVTGATTPVVKVKANSLGSGFIKGLGSGSASTVNHVVASDGRGGFKFVSSGGGGTTVHTLKVTHGRTSWTLPHTRGHHVVANLVLDNVSTIQLGKTLGGGGDMWIVPATSTKDAVLKARITNAHTLTLYYVY